MSQKLKSDVCRTDPLSLLNANEGRSNLCSLSSNGSFFMFSSNRVARLSTFTIIAEKFIP